MLNTQLLVFCNVWSINYQVVENDIGGLRGQVNKEIDELF